MKNSKTFRRNKLLVILSLTFVGCSGDPMPDGMPDLQPLVLCITQAGQPLEGATIQLIANDPTLSRWASGGVTDAEGEVSLQTLGQYEGVVPGSYKVTFYKMLLENDSAAELPDNPNSSTAANAYIVIDPKYQAANTTPIEIEVLNGTDSLPPIDVGKPVKLAQKPM